ncbi:hypothetical protein QFC20_001148 [Naganishia adeliensis]|uniref:Uncharacterized protein n=1 Tax=Naganishia adeliensis TaxID=92952 RepID=A0ACC2WV31_9TREE|nr:hypothetical protein QFC20_001148 [Naganishia adeliensis]
MSRSSTPASDDDRRRDSGEMLFIGQRCAHDACSLVDFLPLKCQYCRQPYCSTHFPASTHACPSMPPAHTLNRIAPICPMCNIPQSTNPGEDPNIVMNRHIQHECQGARTRRDEIRELKARKEKGEVCWKKNCTKVLVVNMKCDVTPSTSSIPPQVPKPTVPSSFPRFSLKNNLTKSTPAATASSSTPTTTTSLLTPSGNPRKDAALAAIKRSLQKKSESAATNTSKVEVKEAAADKGKPTLTSVMQSFKSGSTPTLSKEAKAELESQFRSMENRYKKGLLSASDKVKYAEMCAQRESARRNGLINKNEQCVVC